MIFHYDTDRAGLESLKLDLVNLAEKLPETAAQSLALLLISNYSFFQASIQYKKVARDSIC